MNLYENNDSSIQNVDFNTVLTKTFFRMFLGLLASALTAFYTYKSGLYVQMIMGGYYSIFAIAEIVMVVIFSLAFRKLSPTMVTVLYFAYAFLNGATLAIVFEVFEISSVIYALAGTAAFFGVLSYIGAKTQKDLSNWGSILLTALIISIIVSVINLLVGSTMLDLILDWAMIFLFAGLTIYDVNRIKALGEEGFCEDEKLYIYGAMELYLDFINIFLRILSLFGKRK